MSLLGHLTDEAILAAIGGGARTANVLDRLNLPNRYGKGEHLWFAALRRRLRRMKRDGLVKLSVRYSYENSLYWEPTP